jgi:hypothetical protein
MVPDLAQSPPLFSTSLHRLTDAFGPQYSVHIEPLLGVRQPIPLRRKRCDFLSVDEIQGVDMCRTMPMRAHSIDIPQEVAVRDAVVELALGIWSSELVEGIRGDNEATQKLNLSSQSGKAYSRGLRNPKDLSWYSRRVAGATRRFVCSDFWNPFRTPKTRPRCRLSLVFIILRRNVVRVTNEKIRTHKSDKMELKPLKLCTVKSREHNSVS